MKSIITLLCALVTLQSMAQEIAGHIVDQKKEPVTAATVFVTTGGANRQSTTTDFDGNYVIKSLEPGHYDLVACSAGYDTMTIVGILVSPDQRTTVNAQLAESTAQPVNNVRTYKKPVISNGRDAFLPLALTNISDVSETPSCILYQKGGRGISAPARRGPDLGTLYIIDGVRAGNTGVNNAGSAVNSTNYYRTDRTVYNPSDYTYNREEINQMPYRSINDIVSLQPGVYQNHSGAAISVYGARSDGNQYIADGMHTAH